MKARTAKHREQHVGDRIGWLRAAVLGANDGLLSTASLIIGVASAQASAQQILITGLAGLAAGAMSMAAGEYVSVSSQADAERADLAVEAQELATEPEAEARELQLIYQRRGLDPALAHEVARQLMEVDALGAHARDELGMHEANAARPVQAAFASALSFTLGAVLPILAALLMPSGMTVAGVTLVSLAVLVLLGSISARAGGAPVVPASLRVLFWGALAMGVTAFVGHAVGMAV
jgi:VIT1/CCC1 family predicted Fe2+/Mn2+ transporter